MKAVVFDKHGGPEVLQYKEVQSPHPKPGEVLVRIKYSALNRLDLWVRKGWPGIKLAYPHILGADGAGEIATVGEGVLSWKTNERVVINANIGCGNCEYCLAGLDNRCQHWNLLGETIPGTYAEYVTVPEHNVLAVPEHYDLQAAASAGLVYHTAWHSLVVRGNIQPGDHILIVGASGGVNSACIQIAKLFQAKIYVVGSTQEKLELAESLGADELINRMKITDWSKEVFYRSNKRGMDLVVDNVGTTFPQSIRTARKGGRILTVGNTNGYEVYIDNRYIFSKHLSLIGSTMGTRSDFNTVMNLIFAGKLKPVIDRSYPLSQAAAAHQRLEKGEQLGKITLSIE